ncbi:MAG: 4Fe-4S ferredoxin [Desulfovibrionaceae bacterium CG1_02_65_16]|nr:MAG: 4Fe-4S ferredoxin [Desulfovibrionaceae bacterium CG1_02_65_16]
MPPLMLVVAVLGHLLLAAHALRRGDWPLCAALALLPLSLLTRRASARLVCAAALVVGAGWWADAAMELARQRVAFGEPWTRLTLILSAVCLLSLSGGLWLLGARARAIFSRAQEAARTETAAFLLTGALLAVARAKAAVPVLLADRFLPGSGWLELLMLAAYAAWLAGRFLDPQGHRRLRPRVWALFSAVFFAQLALGLSGLTDLLMTGRLHLPVPALIAAGPIYRGGGLFMPILFGVAALLLGPAWCSHLCYIGAWDDVASRQGPTPPRQLSRRWIIGGRLATLVIACGGALILRLTGAPLALAVALASILGLIGVGVMLLASRRMGAMVHCTAFCPMGLVGNILGRLSPWRMRMRQDRCTRCGVCARACRYGALTPLDIAAARPGLSCTLCGDCVCACPHDALHYRLPGLPPATARAAFVTLAAVLHAVFLGVARI